MTLDALLIAGPTASGKSSLALALAEALNGTIINADSMQVYRELRILTARPTSRGRSPRSPSALWRAQRGRAGERRVVARGGAEGHRCRSERRASADPVRRNGPVFCSAARRHRARARHSRCRPDRSAEFAGRAWPGRAARAPRGRRPADGLEAAAERQPAHRAGLGGLARQRGSASRTGRRNRRNPPQVFDWSACCSIRRARRCATRSPRDFAPCWKQAPWRKCASLSRRDCPPACRRCVPTACRNCRPICAARLPSRRPRCGPSRRPADIPSVRPRGSGIMLLRTGRVRSMRDGATLRNFLAPFALIWSDLFRTPVDAPHNRP